MNPFGNKDEPYPPDWFMHSAIPWPEWMRFVGWYVRNPLHNFMHYQVGWTGKPFSVHGNERDADNDGFADQGGWMHCTLVLGAARRHFLSHSLDDLQAYVGWHPSSGKLGARGWMAWMLFGLISALIIWITWAVAL